MGSEVRHLAGPNNRATQRPAFHYERHRPERAKLYQLVQQHAATFFAAVEAATDAILPQFVKDEFDAFRECGILAHGSLRLHCGGLASLLIHPRPVPSQGRRRTVIRATGLRQSRSAALKLPMP